MNQLFWRRVGLIAAPLLVGTAVALVLNQEWLPNRRFQNVLIFDLVLLATAAGATFSLLLALVEALRAWNRRQAQQAILRAEQRQQQARRDFLKRLDHELKNPLTIMHLGVLNLQQSGRLAPPEQESLARIGQQTQRLQKLVVDLRWLADLEEGEIERAPVDLRDVLAEAIELAREGASQPDRPVTLIVQETPWPLTAVSGDRELLVLAFRNLVENALKFTAAADRVEVRAGENGQAAVVEVADTGPGIPDEEQALIFENLYRSANARSVPGSGLGLPLVQRIVALHGGQVAVRSRPQAGSLFTVWLPLAAQRE